MLTSNELLSIIEDMEDNGLDLSFEVVMLQLRHRLRPDVPITIYIGGDGEYDEDMHGDLH